MKKAILIAAAVTLGFFSNNLFAQTMQKDTAKKTPTPTTSNMAVTKPDTSAKDIQATLANVADLSTLVAAIKAANLDETLKGPGPFTVLAPDNSAFSALPKTKVDSLMKDPVKLAALVKGHVIAGRYDKAALIKALGAGKGTAVLKTVDGQTLTLSVKDKKLAITDAQGTVVEVTSFDTPSTNGLIDGVNGVLMSK
ncbi:fasciclin domain-containing protein [Mucilaginibacter sp.]|uniref:fasciclin domain-containing protein n=1 Tax=Mucilaginibacter sp. TaxID=1882438 RepID=UPI003D123870